jgi:hypothetical protein
LWFWPVSLNTMSSVMLDLWLIGQFFKNWNPVVSRPWHLLKEWFLGDSLVYHSLLQLFQVHVTHISCEAELSSDYSTMLLSSSSMYYSPSDTIGRLAGWQVGERHSWIRNSCLQNLKPWSWELKPIWGRDSWSNLGNGLPVLCCS